MYGPVVSKPTLGADEPGTTLCITTSRMLAAAEHTEWVRAGKVSALVSQAWQLPDPGPICITIVMTAEMVRSHALPSCLSVYPAQTQNLQLVYVPIK